MASAALSPGGRRGRLSILIYHRVVSETDALQPDIPTAVQFDWQMRLLAAHFNVLGLPDATRRLAEGTLPPRAVCITFDDGYADNREVALPILQRYQLPATFFVAVGFLEGGIMFNDMVIESVRRAESDQLDLTGADLGKFQLLSVDDKRRCIEQVLNEIKALRLDERQERVSAISDAVPGAPNDNLMMTHAQLRELADSGMEIGGHTVRHPILASVSSEEAEREIAGGKAALEAIVDRPVRCFAYPNGRPDIDYKREHVDMVEALGFEAAVSTAWGVSRTDSDPFQLPRFTPWDRAPARFAARMFHNCTRLRPEVCERPAA